MLALAAGACSASDAEPSRALVELERLAFVPASPSRIEGYSSLDKRLADLTLDAPILMDRYEVTRDDWKHWFGGDASTEPRAPWARAGSDSRLDWPASLSFDEALELARRRGMRLPSAREWLHVATGGRALEFPWGAGFQASVANTLELGLGRPAPVGTFENGKSRRFACYDLLGNLWEWVDDRVPGFGGAPAARDDPAPFFTGDDVTGDGWRSVLGGSYTSRYRSTYGSPRLHPARLVFHALTLDRAHQAPDIGVRCCADARAYLAAKAPEWGDDPIARERLFAIGRRWAAEVGREAVVPLLEELADESGAAPGLARLVAGARAPKAE